MADPNSMMAEVKAHPYIMAGGALAIVLIIWYAISAGSSSAPAAAAAPDDSATNDAAGLAATQAAANAQLAGDQLAAGVANAQTAGAVTLGLASTSATETVDNNQIAATQAISLANIGAQLSAALAATQAQVSETYSTNSAAVALGAESGIVSNISSITGALTSYLGGASGTTALSSANLYSVQKGAVEAANAQLSTIGLVSAIQAGGGSANVSQSIAMSGNQPIVQNYNVSSGGTPTAAAGYTVQH